MSSPAAVVLVNFRCADLVAQRAEEAIAEHHRVVVTDNSGEYTGPGDIVRPGRNLGFGLGCNAAVDTLTDESWVCLVNPDTVLTSTTHEGGVLQVLVDACERAALDAGAPTLRTDRGVIRRGYRFPHVPREVLFTAQAVRRYSPSQVLAPDTTPVAPPPDRKRRRLVTGPRFGSGALLAVRLESWRRVRGFDDRFVLYGEDLDFWRRLETSGASVGFVDSIEVAHRQGQGSPTQRIDRDVLRWAGIQLFVQLHHGSAWRLYRTVHSAGLSRLVGGAHSSTVVDLVHDAWSTGTDPIGTGLRLRAAFDDGLMGRPADAIEST